MFIKNTNYLKLIAKNVIVCMMASVAGVSFVAFRYDGGVVSGRVIYIPARTYGSGCCLCF